ncbi:hypothetical protein MBLNU457_7654t1 [Dothideomycetes sp. NU457]
MSDTPPKQPMFYGRRENGDCVPLIPVDELPSIFRLKNVKSVLDQDETNGMICVGNLETSGRFDVAGLFDKQSPSALYPISPPGSRESLVTQVPASGDEMPMSPVDSEASGSCDDTSKTHVIDQVSDTFNHAAKSTAAREVLSAAEESPELPAPISIPHVTSSKPSAVAEALDLDIESQHASAGTQASLPRHESPQPSAIASAPGSRYNSPKPSLSQSMHARPPAAGIQSENVASTDRLPVKPPTLPSKFPILKPGEKVYCTHWVRYGVCDFIQQGCKYRHEMPTADVLKKITGMRDMPLWWKNKRLQQFEKSVKRNKEVGMDKGKVTSVGRSVDKPASHARRQHSSKLRTKKSTTGSEKATVSDSEMSRRTNENKGRSLRFQPSHPAMEASNDEETDLKVSEPIDRDSPLIDLDPAVEPPATREVTQSSLSSQFRRATIHAAGTDAAYFVPPMTSSIMPMERIARPQSPALD